MKKIILFFLVAIYQISWAQCPSIDFTLPASACKNETFSPASSISNAATFNWDFCDGSIAKTPISALTKTVGSANSAFDIKFVEENNKVYGFAVNLGNSSLLKFDFGSDPTATPVITDMGNLGVINSPLGINFWEESGLKYALVATNPGDMFLLSFGGSITNVPTAAKIPALTGLDNHRHIKIIKDNGSILALIAGGSTGKLSILNFGSSILNQPTQTSVVIPSTSFPTGLDVVIECGVRYAIVSGYGSGIHILNFGASFLNSPSFILIGTVSAPLGLSVIKSLGNYYLVVSSDAEGIVRYNLGSSISASTTPPKTILGKFSTIDFAIAFSVVKYGSKYFGVSLNLNDQKLTVLDFPKDCEILESYDNTNAPVISYMNNGSYFITLNAIGNNNELVSLTKNFEVSYGGNAQISAQNECVQNDVVLSFSNAPSNVIQTDWDFGDGNISSAPNPIHQFALTGSYNISLKITGSNGCFNTLTKNVAIYNPPVADFTVPPVSPLCSNQLYLFKNTSTSDIGSTLSYQWKINSLDISTTTDLSYAFPTTNSQQIDLVATIPGCSTLVTKTISSLAEGPVVDFTSTGTCAGDTYQLTNATQGNPDNYSWDFGDGQSSAAPNPQHIYDNSGTYQVSLTASNSMSGCNNVTSKSIMVYSKPQPDFSLALPPFSCSGSPSQFNDLTPNPTDSNLNSWLWNFDDPSSGQNTSPTKSPQHTYVNAGDYNVSLTVTTNFNCAAFIQKTVTVSQAPDATFTNTPVCEGQSVTFYPQKGQQSYYWQIGSTFYYFENPSYTFTSGDNSVNFTITANNNCVASSSKVLTVPDPLTPDFSFQKNCNGQNTTFVDLTTSADDPIVNRDWNFGGLNTRTGSPARYTFENLGSFNVTLNITTASGCVYSGEKMVPILQAPVASFTASPEGGAPPLTVKFTNNSINATDYLWAFNNGFDSTSIKTSPQFIFLDYGDYVVDLTASNVQGCSDTFSKIITTILPITDVSLTAFTLSKNSDGSWRGIVTLKNNGNAQIADVDLSVDLSGNVTIREKVAGPIAPNQVYNHVINDEILDSKQLNYLCAEVELANDQKPENNKVCTSVSEQFFWYDAFPNPAVKELDINWIADSTTLVEIELIDAMGRHVLTESFRSVIGLNQAIVAIDQVSSGFYILTMKAGQTQKTQRIAVTGN